MNTVLIKELIQTAVAKFDGGDADTKIVTDFHIKVDSSDGTSVILDDEDKLLSSLVIASLVGRTSDGVATVFRNSLSELNSSDCFAHTSVFKPFSFLLEDADGEMLSELFVVDDENIILTDNELLKGLDQELDEFLTKLLAE